MIVPRLYTDDVLNSRHSNAIFDEPAFSLLTKEQSTFYETHTSNMLKTIRIPVHIFTYFYLGFSLILSSHLLKIMEIKSMLKM